MITKSLSWYNSLKHVDSDCTLVPFPVIVSFCSLPYISAVVVSRNQQLNKASDYGSGGYEFSSAAPPASICKKITKCLYQFNFGRSH